MATRATLRGELEYRLGDVANAIWTDNELNAYLDTALKGMYPMWYQRVLATTTATDGPIQTAPAGARNLYMIGLQREGSTRVRPQRGWTEGNGDAFVPKTGITGQTLVWGWTAPYAAPANDSVVLTVPPESEEYIVLRAHITALERLLTDRVQQEKFHALQVRQGVTEEDIATTLDALHETMREIMERAMPAPEISK